MGTRPKLPDSYFIFCRHYGNHSAVNTSDDWHFSVAPYGWLSSLSSDITIKNTTNHLFIPFGKILKEIDFAGEIHIEANRGPWTFMLDPTYIKLSSKSTVGPIFVGPLKQYVVGPITIHSTAQTLLIDGGIFYRAYENQTAADKSISIEALGVAHRVLKIDVTKSDNLAFTNLMYGPEVGFAYLF